MSLLGSMIVAVCVSSQGSYQPACNHALDAGTQVTGISQNMNYIETESGRRFRQFAEESLGDNGKQIAGSMIFILKTASERTLVIPIPTRGLADTFDTRFRPDGATISIGWSF